jgi:MurNAc alpha-1-phosphate uridylyltransferase
MRNSLNSVMLFAAGFGTRMGDLTNDRPKPLIKVAGKPLIDHALDQIKQYGAETIVANLHYKPKMLRDHLEPLGVRTSLEQPDILETGGGLRAALPLLGEGPCFTMNTDAVWQGPNPLTLLADEWNSETMDALLLCVPQARTVGHAGQGDFILSDTGKISRGPGLVYSGVQIIKPDLLQEIEEQAFSLNLLWDRMLSDGRLYGASYPGKWCDVGHPDGIKLAENMLTVSDV